MPLTDKSYTEVAEADEFWSDRNDSEWAALSEPDKIAGLIRATEYIDSSYNWIGSVADDDQRLAWPRTEAVDKEGRTRTGIPIEIKNATAWLAKQAVTTELQPVNDQSGIIKRLKADVVEIEYAEGSGSTESYGYVLRLLKNLVVSPGVHRDLIRS